MSGVNVSLVYIVCHLIHNFTDKTLYKYWRITTLLVSCTANFSLEASRFTITCLNFSITRKPRLNHCRSLAREENSSIIRFTTKVMRLWLRLGQVERTPDHLLLHAAALFRHSSTSLAACKHSSSRIVDVNTCIEHGAPLIFAGSSAATTVSTSKLPLSEPRMRAQ